MPSRNVSKPDIAEAYFHVYARGASKQPIFRDRHDYAVFEQLCARYLSTQPSFSQTGLPYPHLTGKVELLAYCLMGNHFHLLLYQIEPGTMTRLMSGLLTSYSHYFNRKYHRSGSLLESRYKAAHIINDGHLQHISRYIHMNPRFWRYYRYSSLCYYLGQLPPEWLQPDRILTDFHSSADYLQFLKQYQSRKQLLETIKHELADC